MDHPKDNTGRHLRKSTYVVPPEETDEFHSDEPEKETSLQNVIKRTRRERPD